MAVTITNIGGTVLPTTAGHDITVSYDVVAGSGVNTPITFTFENSADDIDWVGVGLGNPPYSAGWLQHDYDGWTASAANGTLLFDVGYGAYLASSPTTAEPLELTNFLVDNGTIGTATYAIKFINRSEGWNQNLFAEIILNRITPPVQVNLQLDVQQLSTPPPLNLKLNISQAVNSLSLNLAVYETVPPVNPLNLEFSVPNVSSSELQLFFEVKEKVNVPLKVTPTFLFLKVSEPKPAVKTGLNLKLAVGNQNFTTGNQQTICGE